MYLDSSIDSNNDSPHKTAVQVKIDNAIQVKTELAHSLQRTNCSSNESENDESSGNDSNAIKDGDQKMYLKLERHQQHGSLK